MLSKLKSLNQRTICGIGAGAVALSLVLGGVFAWADNSQHKTNTIIGGGKNVRNDIVLVEDFKQPEDWQQGDELKKNISVKNNGDGQLFVRVQLKEYMDIAEIEYKYTNDKLLVDASGRFVAGATKADLKAWLDQNGVTYADSQIQQHKAYGDADDEVKFYLATNENTNINGRDGKYLLLDYIENAPEPLISGASRAAYTETQNHRTNPTGECGYFTHLWQGETFAEGAENDPFHEYVKWNMGAPLLKMSAWDGIPVAAWVLDDTSPEGWAYWGEPLRPGDSTVNLLNSLTLIKQPSGPFYYAMHVDLQAVDSYQLTAVFTGMNPKIEDSFRGKIGLAISADSPVVNRDGKVNFTAMFNGNSVSLSDVRWNVVKGTAPGKGDRTTITDGVLTVGPYQSLGTLIVTATYTDSSNKTYTRQFTITVKDSA